MTPLSSPYLKALGDLQAGQPGSAEAAFRTILASDPGHDGARRNLIRALLLAHRHEAVIEETAIALARDPDDGEFLFLRGTALNALARPSDARIALTAAVSSRPDLAAAWLNLGNAHADLDDLPGAEVHCRHALALAPALIEAHVSLGFILTSQGRLAEAITALELATRLRPDHAGAHWNLAVACLLAGDLPRGLAEYEWRKRHDRFRQDFINPSGPVWDGGEPAGRTILVHAEQGFGDTIQFARYLPLIARLGGRPILACDPCLIPFLSASPDIPVVSKFEARPEYDAWIDQMSLPRALGTTLETIPEAAGYLRAPSPLDLGPGRHVGIAWRGNPAHGNDRRRTPAFEVFGPLLDRDDVHFVSLVPDQTPSGVCPPPVPLLDYAATANVIAGLDLVITVDTSVAHVAGAMGCPAWVLLPFAPDWRWLLHRTDTPWYDSVRLFRQAAPGDWRSVIRAVVQALAEPDEIGLTSGNDQGRARQWTPRRWKSPRCARPI